MTRLTRCIDCLAEGSTSTVMAPNPGPRCLKHWRLEKKRRSKAAHAKRTEEFFGISGEDYWALYEAQGEHCFICEQATGARKRLAVDHDHNLCGDAHDPKMGCRKCVRALLCGRCNKMVGLWNVEALHRAIEVLESPPAQKVLARLESKRNKKRLLALVEDKPGRARRNA